MPGRIHFTTESEATAEQFVREYVLDVLDRASTIEGCDGVAFGLNEPPNPDGGSVTLDVFGDAEAFVDHERNRWERHREAGQVNGWDHTPLNREAMEAQYGKQGTELSTRLVPMADKMAKVVYEEFDNLDDLPAPLDTFPEEDTEAGWWIVPHHIAFASLGYSATDELAMHLGGIEESLRILAERESEAEVDAQIDDLVDALEEMRESVKDGRGRG